MNIKLAASLMILAGSASAQVRAVPKISMVPALGAGIQAAPSISAGRETPVSLQTGASVPSLSATSLIAPAIIAPVSGPSSVRPAFVAPLSGEKSVEAEGARFDGSAPRTAEATAVSAAPALAAMTASLRGVPSTGGPVDTSSKPEPKPSKEMVEKIIAEHEARVAEREAASTLRFLGVLGFSGAVTMAGAYVFHMLPNAGWGEAIALAGLYFGAPAFLFAAFLAWLASE